MGRCDYETVAFYMDQAIHLDYDDVDLYIRRAKASEELGENEKAISDYNLIIYKRPTFEWYNGRALIYFRTTKYGAALNDYEASLNMSRNDEALFGRGLALLARGQPDWAEDVNAALDGDANLLRKFIKETTAGMSK